MVMNETVKLILSLSLSGSILAVLIFAIKPLIKHRLSKAVQYYIWIVVLIRLILPFSLEGSIMNQVLGSNMTYETGSQIQKSSEAKTDKSHSSSFAIPDVKENTAKGVYNYDTDHSRYFRDLFNQYLLYIWLIGALTAITVNLFGYFRFLNHIKRANKPADDWEYGILMQLLKGSRSGRLFRNRFVTTPMLIGIIRPLIVIPDTNFNEKQLKNILLHEITHLKRFDIGIKWLAMIATSLHWFNPFMYFIKKEINRACELSCDEMAIKNLSPTEKQAYGDTLIDVVSESKYPVGVLQATMSEEKTALKDRLAAIMKHSKKSKICIVISVFLFLTVILGSLYLGGGVVMGSDAPPKIYISAEGEKTKEGTYNLKEIAKYKTPYVGDAGKVSAIARQLPVPNRYFKQQYISMKTKEKPYNLTIYYEAASDTKYEGAWPIATPGSAIETNSRTNALIAFCMVDNLDEVTFAFRISQSSGSLNESKYDTTYNFQRAWFEEKYGDLSSLGKNLQSLEDILAGNNPVSMPEFTNAEVASARKVVEEYFRAITVKDDKAILAAMHPKRGYTMDMVRSGSVILYGTEIRTLKTISYDSQDRKRQNYRPGGSDIALENIIVFKVSFNIEYPLKDGGPWNEGIYDNWSMILIRDDKNSPWFIYDQGY